MKTQNEITANIYPKVGKLAMSAICDYPGQGKASHVVISNGKIVQACSATYGLLKNEDFFGAFEKQLKEEGIAFTAKYRNIKDAQFSADYVLDGEMSVATSKDVVKPQIRLINSYDGSSPSAGYLGFYRKVCSNGLHAMQFNLDFKVRHTENGVSLTIPKIQTLLEKYRKTTGVNIIRRFEVLAEQLVNNPQDIVREVANGMKLFKFEKSDNNDAPSLNAEFVLDIIKKESKLLNVKPNKWIIYNAMNEWLNSDERNKKTDAQRTVIDSRLFAEIEAI